MGCSSVENVNKVINISIPRKYTIIQTIYIDKSFPHENTSIFGIDNLNKINKGEEIPYQKNYNILIKDFKENQIIWKRIDEIFNNKKYILFPDKITSNSIIQGTIGNCYFLTVITSLIKYPSLLYQLFNNNLSISQNGHYEINLKINKKISTIHLDDYFPYNTRKSKPVFCKPYNNEIWVMLLEKAWAKIKGSYFGMDIGSPIEVLNAFLLSSDLKKDILYKFYSLKNSDDKNEIWNIMMNKIKNNNIFMICLSKENLKDKKKLNNLYYSIVEKHFYNIIDVYTNEGKNILKLRNPWGFNLKNKNYKNIENDIDFIIEENNNDLDNNTSMNNGEFEIDFNYFCYLFEEIQVYEIKKFSININCILKHDKIKFNLVYLNIKEKLKAPIKVKIILDAKICHIDNKYLDFKFLIIEKERMNIIYKKNHKIDLKSSKFEFDLISFSNNSNIYYLFFVYSFDLNNLENINIKTIFQSDDYFELINYHHYYDDKRLEEVLKNEFLKYNIKINSLEYKEKIF